MLLTRWNPFAELAAMERTADQVFSPIFGAPDWARMPEPAFWRLPVTVEEVEGQYRIKAPVPGMKPEDVEISYADGVLSISAQHGEEKASEGDGYVRKQAVTGSFFKQVRIGEVDPESIAANLEEGVLTVTVPAPPKPEPVKIAINAPTARALKPGSRKQMDARTT